MGARKEEEAEKGVIASLMDGRKCLSRMHMQQKRRQGRIAITRHHQQGTGQIDLAAGGVIASRRCVHAQEYDGHSALSSFSWGRGGLLQDVS